MDARGSDGDDSALVASVRARLASGDLPRAGLTLTAGPGTHGPCIVCLMPIAPRQIEYEVSDNAGGVVVAHFRCYLLWRAETRRRDPEV
jgi:hypothetical protein